MKLSRLFLIITCITSLFVSDRNFQRISHQWLDFINESISHNLHDNLKFTMLCALFDTMQRYVKIWNVCFCPKFSYCHGSLKGLCGSVEVVTDQLMDCVWELQVPKSFCTNVTIDHFPNGDPFIYDYFVL